MITPEPMPVVGAPKGEKSFPEMPSAVIVTTDFCAAAMTSVRSTFWTLVDPEPEPVLVAWAGGATAAGVAVGWATSVLTANAVPPAASTALSSETPRIVAVPVCRRARLGLTGAVATTGAPGGSGDCQGVCRGAGGGVGVDASGVEAPELSNGSYGWYWVIR